MTARRLAAGMSHAGAASAKPAGHIFRSLLRCQKPAARGAAPDANKEADSRLRAMEHPCNGIHGRYRAVATSKIVVDALICAIPCQRLEDGPVPVPCEHAFSFMAGRIEPSLMNLSDRAENSASRSAALRTMFGRLSTYWGSGP